MIYRVEVSIKEEFRDARGESIRRQVEALGIYGVQAVSVTDLYFLQGDELCVEAVHRLVHILLHDPVVENAAFFCLDGVEAGARPSARSPISDPPGSYSVEVTLLPGVTDSVAESLLEGAKMIGVDGLERAATGHRYVIVGEVTGAEVRRIAEELLANEVIQTYAVNRPVDPPFAPVQAADDTVEVIPLTEADDAALEAISRERRLSLDLAEMRAIREYYRQEGREPTDVELETLAQTWSEHCVHKTFKALIEYEEQNPDGTPIPGTRRLIDSLLGTYIRAATEKVNKPWVRSAFVDNAGIVAFNEQFDLAFKVETHNHPSALEPFGGANTGVGGVIRDVIGVSARPIANTDVLCFGPPDLPFSELPAGVLHPRRIADGVTAGIEDYGNKMGIPTVNGAILYDPGYTANPLVFCGCLGILPRGAHRRAPQAGDLVVVIGGRTGRDGLRGATFSSMEMTHETGQVAGSAVQIGHPIHEKQVLEAVLIARDEGLYTAITDCGAGGLSSAVGEMGAELGAEVHLERVPLKYAGLRPWEIWLSEAQERMVLAVPPAHWPRLQQICASLDVEATVIGAFTGDGRLTLRYHGRVVGQLSTEFLHHGIPRRRLKAVWTRSPNPREKLSPVFSSAEWGLRTPPEASTGRVKVPQEAKSPDLTAELLALLAMPDTRSKEDVVRRYDHEVQAGTVIKPFVGQDGSGPSDAAVLVPLEVLQTTEEGAPLQGIALAVGINPYYGMLDPYVMAWAAVDEAIRNCVAVGADPDRIALLDNFCWGNPNLPDRLGGLVRCAQGCHDAAIAYGAPFVSGKDSLNNEYVGADGCKHAIPGTLLISALGIVPDVRHAVTMDLKAPGDWLYVVGITANELGGSAYYRRHSIAGGQAPQPDGGPWVEQLFADPKSRVELYRALHRAMAAGLVRACHDCSEGGIAVAVAEMALAGGLGLEICLADVPRTTEADRDDVVAFSESLGRLVVEVAPEHARAFEAYLAGFPLAQLGRVRNDDRVQIMGLHGQLVVDTDLGALDRAWRGHLNAMGGTQCAGEILQ
ncbi:MAG: phosphoribosylformylglycinamidine synthase subunit PurL [Anaerolineae bacterium]|nr:phosphoribosylformylglycinamidine synthase subunit PurL [Anaerolineae bacterium]MDW8098341.1 phosphoribosylformylglycinamidine synthase subunit PurL [Anaerolineae bacterium]